MPKNIVFCKKGIIFAQNLSIKAWIKDYKLYKNFN